MKTFELEEVTQAMDLGTGFCTECGAESDCVEPDARKYECDVCGENAVYGAEELLVMGLVE